MGLRKQAELCAAWFSLQTAQTANPKASRACRGEGDSLFPATCISIIAIRAAREFHVPLQALDIRHFCNYKVRPAAVLMFWATSQQISSFYLETAILTCSLIQTL